MAEIIDTAVHDFSIFDSDESYWVYNGLDNCVTYDVFNTLIEQADDVAKQVYNLSLDLQAPILEMNTRGLRVNNRRKFVVMQQMKDQIRQLEGQLDRIIAEGIGLPDLNWRSPTQLKALFYDILGMPVQKKRNANGVFAPTTDEAALEKLSQYFLAEPLCSHLLALRGLGKSLGFLNTEIDADGRMRTRFNIAGTNTGRLASSATDIGTGTNLQNVTSSLRSVFVADPGMMFCNIDLEQADSRNMGALCWNMLLDADRRRISHLLQKRGILKKGEEWRGPIGAEFAGAYLDACESGDLHTVVTKMAYRDLAWGTAPDREIADQLCFRHYEYRFMSKKLGHGSNYLGTPPTMAKHARLPVPFAKSFQEAYFAAFPCIPAVQAAIIEELELRSCLTTPLGRRRFFWGRSSEGATQREAVAYMGQSMTADEMNNGLLRLWRSNKVELLIQVHDSILFQFPADKRDEIVPMALEAISTFMELKQGRRFTVGTEAMTGYNWGYVSDDNPDGLKKWKGSDDRKRLETDFKLSLKDF